MVGVKFNLDTTPFEKALAQLSDALDPATVTASLAGVLEGQTRYRLSKEKAAPDGTAWMDWSDGYAATRGGQHSLLESGGDLIDSISAYSTSRLAAVGSPLVYAAMHQFGGAEVGSNIPDREYLGLSDGNADEIIDVIVDIAEGALNV